MEKKKYDRPTCSVIHVSSELMETLPVGNSLDYTDTDGLGKKWFADPNDSNKIRGTGWDLNVWEDD